MFPSHDQKRHNDWADWAKLRDNNNITWISVDSVEKTGRVEKGYDLTVPGTETFVSIDGTVLSNTMAYHVPVSEEAVEEAKEKMLPSQNLLDVKDFGVHYLPEQEFQHGLYLATSRKKKGEPQVFETSKQAIAAYKSGRIDIDSPVIIKELEK